MVRDDNVASIMAKNVLDLILGSVAFFLYGYQLAFGERRKGAALKWCFGSLWPVRFARDPVDFMFHFSFAATASTIDSGCVAERMSERSYLLLSVTTTAVIYPIVAHWCWDPDGWLNKAGYVDFAGSSTVHLVGGVSAIVCASFVGPRIGRFPDYEAPRGAAGWLLHGGRMAPDGYYRGLFGVREQIAARGLPYFTLRSATNMLYGSFLLFCSWFAFNTGSTFAITGADAQTVGGIAISTVLSASGGGAATYAYDAMITRSKRVSIDNLCNGLIAGLVASSCGCAHWRARWARR